MSSRKRGAPSDESDGAQPSEAKARSEPEYALLLCVDIYGSTEQYGAYYAEYGLVKDHLSKLYRSTEETRQELSFPGKRAEGNGFDEAVWKYLEEQHLDQFTDNNHCIVTIIFIGD